ncbi:MAG TPA: hypothetical protein VH250_03505 [Granulicella sp.]|nr:hypothetical protein [Granulicella sp.]
MKISSKSLTEGRRSSTVRLLLGVLCILLVLLGGTIEAAHSHPGLAPHPDCALCATAHVVAQVVAAPSLPAVAMLVEAVPQRVPLSAARALSIFDLFTRPPPSCSTLA